MCTCITMKTRDVYFGRTMDIHYRFGEQVSVTPRGFRFPLKSGDSFENWYAMIGMASVHGDYPLYAEATNERGLSMAGLNFPENAWYGEPIPGKRNLTPYELIPWVLGSFGTLEEVRRELSSLWLVNIPLDPDTPVAPLHWMISDAQGSSIVLEQTREEGLRIYDNPFGVLTNNPTFPYHSMNLNSFMNLTSSPPQNRFCKGLDLTAFGSGMGSIGLPGDNSPTSRFVRACFNRANSLCGGTEEESVSQFFHILDNVWIVRGSTMAKGNICDTTTYACCMNASRGIYYYKTYSNSQLTAVRLTESNINAKRPTFYPLEEEQQIRFIN
ncbi:choloylglycine hydrolase [Acutalibacter sp. 1XD8-36]|uniref:choloylglycine hydrolase n=1 Tax=Acutalibacter sp. 1XD8-36 TaxID=2320852 RepID=UPI0026070FC6|nr:choloylglycine hydrolase [Acutalibacter sp. 1XD8-36]